MLGDDARDRGGIDILGQRLRTPTDAGETLWGILDRHRADSSKAAPLPVRPRMERRAGGST
jgi:hypothetical protein